MGKTNLLEAIVMIAAPRSFRTAKLAGVAFDAESAADRRHPPRRLADRQRKRHNARGGGPALGAENRYEPIANAPLEVDRRAAMGAAKTKRRPRLPAAASG